MLLGMKYWLLLLGAITSKALQECPHPEDSYPCYCEEEEDRSVMHCNNLDQNKQIVQALSKLTEYEIYTLSMWLYDTDPIKSDAFQGPKFKEIIFHHGQLSMESPQFLGQETSLNRLSFRSCFDSEDPIGSWSLGHLQKLKEISFDKNEIKVLQNNWLTSSGGNLRSITFDECKIEKLEDSVFSKISSLTTIFLTNNDLTSVSRSMFPKEAEDLRSINLSGNKISTLPSDLFKNMPSLTSITLDENLLTTLSESTWSSKIEELSRVYLEGNPINCNKDLKWISKKALPKTFTGNCSKPSSLKGKELRLLTPADFH